MRQFNSLLVTGGRGFIGSAFIRYLLQQPSYQGNLINLDVLTYAALREDPFMDHPRYRFVKGNICDAALVESLCAEVDGVVHFAAETHVDRSIACGRPFIETNVMGTFTLLEAVRKYPHVHFHHVSTDEVYGSLGKGGQFSEMSPYSPNSPYAASKAASDHFVRSFAHTYGLSTTLSHCSNNYGPSQYPEKLVPLVIQRCFEQKPIPVYGRGENMRDWLYVDDHAEALWQILRFGKMGETYDIGGGLEISNLDMVYLLTDLVGRHTGKNYRDLVAFVEDRKGHDFRYAIDATKIMQELGWRPSTPLERGLEKTILSYR